VSDDRVLTQDASSHPLEPYDAGEVVAGSPSAGLASLAEVGGASIGIWELGKGTVRDTEVDEVFIVLAGEATVRFLDSGDTVELRSGTVVRLSAGERTEWEVRSTLRKVYISG
jgi:uncharacterized cupin superfamily protein